jgi:hypothetical protein
VIAPLAAAWSGALAMTGGFLFYAGGVRVSSRNPMTPLLIAAITAAAAFLLAPAGARAATLAADRAWLRGLFPAPAIAASTAVSRAGSRFRLALPGAPSGAAIAACLLAVAIVAIGIGYGTLTAGGSDSYGYVSYARLWATGTLRVDRPLMDELADPDLAAAVPADALVPLAYILRADGTLAPTYSPGLPLIMGLFERIGGASAVFFVVPLLAGIAVWATYLLGRHLGGGTVGLWAAALLAASPIFLHQLTSGPMSDIPAMAWWTVALALLPYPSRLAAGGAGLAAGLAILVRPNLAPLAIVPGTVLLWRAIQERRPGGLAVQRLLIFGAAALPACLALAWINAYWFGSPLLSGYGPLTHYFSRSYLPVNLARYSQWLLDTQTPLVLLALAAPFLLRGAGTWRGRPAWLVPCCAAFAAAAFACYAFYTPFEGWWTLRFLLPGFPALLVLTAGALAALAARAPVGLRGLAPLVLIGVVLYGLATARNEFAFNPESETKYAVAGAYVVERLPDRSVFFSMQHSGSIRYYADRATVRYDFLPPGNLDAAIDALRGLGYHPYALIDEWEEEEFRGRHAGTSRAGALDWDPLVVLEPGGVRIYDLTPMPLTLRRSSREQVSRSPMEAASSTSVESTALGLV